MCSARLCPRSGHFAVTLKVKGKEQVCAPSAQRDHGCYTRHTQAPHAAQETCGRAARRGPGAARSVCWSASRASVPAFTSAC